MKNISKLAIIIVSILAIVTCILFYLFRPAETSLVYWFNLLVFIALDVMLGMLISNGGRNWSIPFYATLWTIFAAYALLSFITMTFYFALVEPGIIRIVTNVTIPTSYFDWVGDNILEKIAQIFQENSSLARNIYFSCFLLMTALSAIALAIVSHFDKIHIAEAKELKERQTQIIDIASEMNVLRKKYQRICQDKDIVYDTHSNNTSAMDPLYGKLQFLTPNVMRHAKSQEVFASIIQTLRVKLTELENASVDEAHNINQQICNYVTDMVDEIDRLKTICRQ